MKREDVEQKVSEILKSHSQFNGDNLKLDCDLRENYGIDSIILVELLIEIECEFNINFDSNLLTYDNLSTGNAICDYVCQKI